MHAKKTKVDKTPEFEAPEGLVKCDGQQFDNFIKATKCSEHFQQGLTLYRETGTRKLIALFHQATGGFYARPRLRSVK